MQHGQWHGKGGREQCQRRISCRGNKSILIDSNIAIYSALPEFDRLREWLFHKRIFVSQITRLEVLGYHSLTVDDKSYFEKFFEECRIVPIGEDEIQRR